MTHEISVTPQIGEIPKLRKDVLAGLAEFGYAPGSYMGKCSGCDTEMWNVDKRAQNCVDCAIAKAMRLSHDAAAALTMQNALPQNEVEAQVFTARANVFASAYASARASGGHPAAIANAIEATERFVEVATGKSTKTTRRR